MTATAHETVVVRSESDFAATIPTIVGFQPVDSLVTVFICDGRVIVTARTDFPDNWQDCAVFLSETAQRVGADEVLIALFSDRGHGDLPLTSEIDSLVHQLRDVDVPVTQALLIDGGRYWSYLCLDESCCNEVGTPFEIAQSFDGLAASRTRQNISDQFALRPDHRPSQRAYKVAQGLLKAPTAQQAEHAWHVIQELTALRVSGTSETCPDTLVAFLHLAMADVRVRDFVLGNVAVATNPSAMVTTLVNVALSAPDESRERLCGAAAVLLAAFESSTIPASTMCDHAGEDSLAGLVRKGISAALPPTEMRSVLQMALPEVLEQLSKEDS
jgi:hypothetical protein